MIRFGYDLDWMTWKELWRFNFDVNTCLPIFKNLKFINELILWNEGKINQSWNFLFVIGSGYLKGQELKRDEENILTEFG